MFYYDVIAIPHLVTSRVAVIAPIGNPTQWYYVRYVIDNWSLATCASFVALARYLADQGREVNLVLIVPDSISDNDLDCLKCEIDRVLKTKPEIVRIEISGYIRGIQYCGDIYAMPVTLLSILLREYLEGKRLVLDLTHGWNILPTLAMYAVSPVRQMLGVEIYLSEPHVRGREDLPRCTDIVQYETKIKTVEYNLSRLRVIRMESLGQISKLRTSLNKIRETYAPLESYGLNKEDIRFLEYAVLASEFYSRGIVTVGWHFMRRLYEYDSPRERVFKIVNFIISSELEVQDDKREISDNVVRYKFKLPKEYLLYLVYDLIVFSKILDIYERDLGYRHGNRPGASIDFEKLVKMVKSLHELGVIDSTSYNVCMVEIGKYCRGWIKNFCEHKARELGFYKVDDVDVLKMAKEDKEKALRHLIAHCGFVCPIVKEITPKTVKLEIDNNAEVCLKELLS